MYAKASATNFIGFGGLFIVFKTAISFVVKVCRPSITVSRMSLISFSFASNSSFLSFNFFSTLLRLLLAPLVQISA